MHIRMEQLDLSNISLPSSPSIRDIDNIVRDLEGEPIVQLHIGQPGLKIPGASLVSILENLRGFHLYPPMGGSDELRSKNPALDGIGQPSLVAMARHFPAQAKQIVDGVAHHHGQSGKF